MFWGSTQIWRPAVSTHFTFTATLFLTCWMSGSTMCSFWEQLCPEMTMVIRHSMTQALKEDPAFEPLKAEPRFQNMVSRLEQNEGET